jgi:hypothetical protein
MLRFSLLIAVLVVASATSAFAQQKNKSTQGQCYNAQTCMTGCMKSGGHYCESWCQNRASTQTPCKQP